MTSATKHKPTSPADLGTLVSSFLDEQRRQIGKERRSILDGGGSDAVHQMRVACRRSRSILYSLQCRDAPLAADFTWLSDEIGKVRDLDVLLESTTGRQASGFAANMETLRERRSRELLCTLQSDTFDQLASGKTSPNDTQALPDLSIKRAAYLFLAAELDRVKRKGRKLHPSSPDKQLHKLRIRCKRLRYLVEMFEYGGLKLGPFRKNAGRLQILLGNVHDEAVAIQSLRTFAEGVPLTDSCRPELLDIGRQIAGHEQSAESLKGRLPVEWKRFDRLCTKKRLKQSKSRFEK